jgi:hypothetical protein
MLLCLRPSIISFAVSAQSVLFLALALSLVLKG